MTRKPRNKEIEGIIDSFYSKKSTSVDGKRNLYRKSVSGEGDFRPRMEKIGKFKKSFALKLKDKGAKNEKNSSFEKLQKKLLLRTNEPYNKARNIICKDYRVFKILGRFQKSIFG